MAMGVESARETGWGNRVGRARGYLVWTAVTRPHIVYWVPQCGHWARHVCGEKSKTQSHAHLFPPAVDIASIYVMPAWIAAALGAPELNIDSKS